MAYRQNNFKNAQVLKQAEDYGNLERMLNHVKNLIKHREKIMKYRGTIKSPPKAVSEVIEEVEFDNKSVGDFELEIEEEP
jgi:hypothetical protein